MKFTLTVADKDAKPLRLRMRARLGSTFPQVLVGGKWVDDPKVDPIVLCCKDWVEDERLASRIEAATARAQKIGASVTIRKNALYDAEIAREAKQAANAARIERGQSKE